MKTRRVSKDSKIRSSKPLDRLRGPGEKGEWSKAARKLKETKKK